jgi:hypothetical protein
MVDAAKFVIRQLVRNQTGETRIKGAAQRDRLGPGGKGISRLTGRPGTGVQSGGICGIARVLRWNPVDGKRNLMEFSRIIFIGRTWFNCFQGREEEVPNEAVRLRQSIKTEIPFLREGEASV